MSEILKTYVTVSEMAEMLCLSRTRFYLLLKVGVFPPPTKSPHCSRRYFDPDGQKQCIEIKRSNQAVDGTPVFFYKKQEKAASKKTSIKKEERYGWVVDALIALGVENINQKSIDAAIRSKFSNGIDQINEETIIRTLYVEFSG